MVNYLFLVVMIWYCKRRYLLSSCYGHILVAIWLCWWRRGCVHFSKCLRNSIHGNLDFLVIELFFVIREVRVNITSCIGLGPENINSNLEKPRPPVLFIICLLFNNTSIDRTNKTIWVPVGMGKTNLNNSLLSESILGGNEQHTLVGFKIK